jgi:4-alpha-glucanotransferase
MAKPTSATTHPLFNRRQSGVLVHPTALPGPFGIGDVGRMAHRFVDWLAMAGQQLWQVLPLNPVAGGNSPYTSPSAFAGNPLLISLEGLLADGLLDVKDINQLPGFARSHVDFDAVRKHRAGVFARAHAAFKAGRGTPLHKAYDAWTASESFWLNDHALFQALQVATGKHAWTAWDGPLSQHDKGAVERATEQLADPVAREKFLQFILHKQWNDLRRYANSKGVRVVGDAPIFVAFDSADVWSNRHLFKLDKHGNRAVVAGVPPDYFSKDGQLWGNPLYNWTTMAKEDFGWWVARIRTLLQSVDIIRIDHFRGFAAAWEVPSESKTARKGSWVTGPGRKVFEAVEKALGQVPLIAEDLGIITPDVEALRDGLALPGMKILQFAFGDADGINAYLPHNFGAPSVVYTGTHDNDTTQGWFRALDDKTRAHVQHYLARDGKDIAWDLIRLAWGSTAPVAIAPVQDILNLGTEARFNTPGVADGNWGWRIPDNALNEDVARRLAFTTQLFSRHPGAEEARQKEKASQQEQA